MVDGLPEDADDFRYPGDAIEPEIQSELERALSGETVLPEKILDTDWGNIFIAYYPLYNESGEVIGALGIEVAADIEAEAVHGLTVAVIDVNNLKLVNDRLGHAVGDDCIVNAARVLQSVESQKVTAYRYGGDEFILLLENYPEPEKLLVRVKEKFAKYGDK